MPIISDEYLLTDASGTEPWKPVEGKYFSDPEGLVPTTEALAQFGGGHTETGQNLLAGLWTATADGANGMPNQGARLIPSSALTDGAIAGISSKGLAPFYSSPTSLRVDLGTQPSGFTADKTYLAVINPPEALKQAIAGSFVWGADPAFSDTVVKKSLVGGYDWRVLFETAGAGIFATSGRPIGIVESLDVVIISSVLSAFSGLPLLRTNGADGEYPQFFDISSIGALKTMQATIDKGDFFIPIIFTWDQNGGTGGQASATIDIEWPSSIPR